MPFPFFPEQASSFAPHVDALYGFMIAVTAFFSLLIGTMVVVFAIKYHDGAWQPHGPRTSPGAQPFPNGYAGDDEIDGADVTLWYVAHVHFDASFPFPAGPWVRCYF